MLDHEAGSEDEVCCGTFLLMLALRCLMGTQTAHTKETICNAIAVWIPATGWAMAFMHVDMQYPCLSPYLHSGLLQQLYYSPDSDPLASNIIPTTSCPLAQ